MTDSAHIAAGRDPADWATALPPGAPVLVTGAAGFIGHAVSARLLDAGLPVVGVDSLNDYYDPALKRMRLAALQRRPGFRFHRLDLADRAAVAALFADGGFHHVIHLAAQAGVRYSIDNPFAYLDSNLAGFLTVLEGCRAAGTRHLLYASSSSVYGGNERLPFSVADGVDHPVSLYAATKKANELMAHAYAHIHGLPCTGLRFFTVYGPMGRPDMAYFRFAEAIAAGRPIQIYNHGRMRRDFTYIDDIAEAVLRLLPRPPVPAAGFAPGSKPAIAGVSPGPGDSWAPWRVLNLGATRPEPLMALVEGLERLLGKPAQRDHLPMQPGDVVATWADMAATEELTGPIPATPLEIGLARFVDWFREYRRLA